VGENHQSEPSANHISMHFKGTKSSGEADHPENRNIMSAIEDLQRSLAAIWVEFQSLLHETTILQAPRVVKVLRDLFT